MRTGEKNIHNESSSGDRHGPEEGRSNTLPETTKALDSIGLGEAVPHAGELLVGTESIGLHFALDHIEGVAGQPQSLTGQTTIGGNLDSRNVLTVDVVALGILVHHVLESHKPRSVSLGLTQNSDGLTAVQTAHSTVVCGQFANAVNRAIIEATGAVRLGLQTNTDVLDWAGQDRVGDTGERTSHIILAIRKSTVGILLLVQGFQATAGLVECTELDTHLRDLLVNGGERGKRL